MKPKIGILNFQHVNHNYGAVLQAAALVSELEKIGCEVEHINFLSKFYPEIRIKESILRNRRLFIWGSGENGNGVLNYCKDKDLKIEAFLDSNQNIKEFEGYKILSPQTLLYSEDKNFFIVISSTNYASEIAKICENAGLKEGEDFWKPYIPNIKFFVPQQQIKFTGQEVFEEFRLKWLKRSSETFLYSNELKEYKFDYDAVIVGSDQVWRLELTKENIHSFFLDFIHAPIKKIAYAASFGHDYFELEKDNPEIQEIKNLLNKFSAISVRETSGIKICKETFDVNAIQVIDPTILAGVDFFNDIIEQENLSITENNPEIVFCMLNTGSFPKELLSYFKNKNYSTDIIFPNKEREESHNFISVALWLEKIKRAKFIITNSFHCVCISLLFEKKFVCVLNHKLAISRLYDLLGDMELKNRIVMDNDSISKIMKLFNEEIQYDKIRKYFEHKREEALKFLRKSLFENAEDMEVL